MQGAEGEIRTHCFTGISLFGSLTQTEELVTVYNT